MEAEITLLVGRGHRLMTLDQADSPSTSKKHQRRSCSLVGRSFEQLTEQATISSGGPLASYTSS